MDRVLYSAHLPLSLLLFISLFFMGCNSYVDRFTLKELKRVAGIDSKDSLDASFAIKKMRKRAVNVARDSITFSDGSYLTKSGFGALKIPKRYKFITESSKYILVSQDSGKFLVIDKGVKSVIHSHKLPFTIVSGKIIGDKIFYISLNNIFGIYSISNRKSLVSTKVGKAYAVDTRISNPIVIKNLLVVPTLDGKLLVINPSNPTGASGMAIGKSFNLNNVIFLGKIENRIIASTPSKLISASPGSMHKYETVIADVTIYKNRIYLLARDGRITILSPSLNVVRTKRFDFKRFSTIAVVGNSIFALDGDGYLLVTNLSLSKSRVYDVGGVNGYTFVANGKLYKDDEVIFLDRLQL
jgi:hypothetical protein